MYLSHYCKIYPDKKDPDSVTLFSTKKAAIVSVPKTTLDDIHEGYLSDDDEQTLGALGFLTDDIQKERRDMLGFIDDLNIFNRTFKAVVVMDLACNLACSYCFEGARKGAFFMTEETAGRFLDFVTDTVKNRPGFFEAVDITFYGGEPLLNTEIIRYISAKLKVFAESAGLSYRASLITNGTLLTPQTVSTLLPLGLKAACITLDGPREIHDVYRPFVSGKGSFDTIVKNIKEIAGSLELILGGNFTKDNYKEFVRLLDYLMAEGITPDKVSSMRFDPVFNESAEFAPPEFTGGCNCVNEPWLYEASLLLREETLKRGYPTSRVMPAPCMMEMQNRLFINYNGEIYKCPGLLGRKEFIVGDIRTGLIDYRQSHNLDNWKNEKCLACAYLPLCFGGCRYMKLIREGNIDGIDCKKEYLDATLEALVMQDIKYGPMQSGE